MKNNKYDTIICDFGKVLLHFDHRVAVRKILQHTPKTEEDVYNLFFDSPLTKLYEEGKISSEEFFARVKGALELGIGKDSFFAIWNDIFFEVPLNRKMHEFLKGVEHFYNLVLLSNINETHFEFLRPKVEILKSFDKIILSYEVGFRKPAPEIYNIAMDSVKTTPEKSFYIDDREDLIRAASKLGIRGIVFDGDKALDAIKKELWITRR